MEKKLKLLVCLMICLACLQCLLIFTIPFVSVEGNSIQRIMAYVVAMFFWLAVISEIIIARQSSKIRAKMERRIYRNKQIRLSSVGILSFFKNKEAMMADVLLFVSVVVLGIVIWAKIVTTWIIICVVSILILSFNMHCILNGRNYRYIKALNKHLKEQG